MLKNLYLRKSIFHKTAEELKQLDKENNIKLLNLLEYIRKRKVKDEK